MQHKPRFSGIIIAAVLMVAALVMISSYSSLFGSSKSTMMLSEAMGYFESNQVTYFNLDLNTGVIEMSVKEGEHPLPESGTSSETSNGLLAEIYGDGTDAYAPKNGGAAVITYKLPYPSYFLQFYLKDYIDQYNAANPDAPMQYDMVAVKTNVPWFEIILYAFMIGSVVLLFMSMYRGGAGGGGLMNVGRAKVKDQQEGQRKATFADVAGADEEKAELQEVVQMVGSDSLPDEQKITLEVAKMIREIFLQQNAYHPVDCYCPIERQYTMMTLIKKYSDLADKALAAGVQVDKIAYLPVRTRFNQAKYEDNTDAELKAVGEDMDKQFAELGV